MMMWKHGAYAILIRSENIISAVAGTSHYTNFLNPFKVWSPVAVSPVVFCRGYRGSNRYKRGKAMNDKLLLRKQLEIEYGISNKPVFNHKEWLKTNYFSEFKAFQARLNIRFNNHKILMSAFAHPSFIEELKLIERNDVSNEETDMQRRFELNDEISDIPFQKLSLLGYDTTLLVIKEEIYKKYPSITSSICSDVSKFLISRETISMIAKNIALEDLILLARELDNTENLNKEYHLKFTKEDILCDTFYSLVGAIVIDIGHDKAKDFVNDFVVVMMNYEDLNDHVQLHHAHEELMKILSLNGVQGNTRARSIAESGLTSHFPFFHAGIYCNGCKIGDGSGYSAYTARIDAFKNAVFSCLEGDVDFSRLRRDARRM